MPKRVGRKTDTEDTTPRFSVRLRDGTWRELPQRECLDWSPGQPQDDRYRPDWAQVPECQRCRGHADVNGWHQGGYIPVLEWDLEKEAWYTRIAACDCVWGAKLAQDVGMQWYDDSQFCLPGLSFGDVRTLEVALRGLRLDPGGLRKACERILVADVRERVERAIDQREAEEREAPPKPEKRPPPERIRRVREMTDALAEAKGWGKNWRKGDAP